MTEDNVTLFDKQCSAVKLIRLSLENFKGVNRFELAPDGRDIRVLGDNASGKTSLADGFSWLLFGKDSQGRADFEIKTLDGSGEALHGLEHTVEAVLDIDGKKAELRKVYREVWTKRRGSADKELTGNTRDHFVDGVPVTQSEYEERIAGLADEKAFRLLTNPIEFAERLHWQERRRILLEVCGDMSDADIIASSQDLADLTKILAGRSIDNHRKVAQAQRRKINQELEKIPIRIDEVTRGLPMVEGDKDSLMEDRASLGIQRRAAADERSRIESGGEIAEKTKRLREIEAEILEERNADRAVQDREANEMRANRASAQTCLDDARRVAARLEKDTSKIEDDLTFVETRMDMLRGKWGGVDAETFSPMPGDDVCAACGQDLPEDRVEAARQKAEREFNLIKAERLSALTAEGKRLKAQADGIKALIVSSGVELEAAKKVEADLVAPLSRLKEKIASLEREDAPTVVSDNESSLRNAKALLETEIAELDKGNEKALYVISDKLESIDTDLIEAETKLSRIFQHREGEGRIESLKGDERRLASEFEGLERQLFLLDEFLRKKVSLLTERINSRFELARFKLFDVLVNGGVEECCEVTHEGVPWPSLNTGAQVNIGLDVIRTLSQHYGIAPPIFIDHSESVTRLLDTPGQQIRLIVTEGQKVLRVEER